MKNPDPPSYAGENSVSGNAADYNIKGKEYIDDL